MTEPRRPVTVLSQRRRVIRGDASLIVGLPLTTGLQYLVLLAAAAVDIVAFNQVLSQALDEYEWVLWGFVGGFTVVCLALAHAAGKQWKEATVARHAPNARPFTLGYAGIWLVLGVIAFVFRWLYVAPATTGTTVEGDGGTQAQVTDGASQGGHVSALLFLGLYLATGALSGGAAYRWHNPAAQQWARAVAKRSRAAARLADLEADLVAAERFSQVVEDMRVRAEQDMALFLALPESLAAKAVADARLRMLDRGQDGKRQQITNANAPEPNQPEGTQP